MTLIRLDVERARRRPEAEALQVEPNLALGMIDPREPWNDGADARWLAYEPVMVGIAHGDQPCEHPMCRSAAGGSNPRTWSPRPDQRRRTTRW